MGRVTIDRLLACVYVAVFVIINLIVNHCGPWVIPITTVAAVCANMMIRSLTPRGFARAVFLANDRAINRTTLNRALPD